MTASRSISSLHFGKGNTARMLAVNLIICSVFGTLGIRLLGKVQSSLQLKSKAPICLTHYADNIHVYDVYMTWPYMIHLEGCQIAKSIRLNRFGCPWILLLVALCYPLMSLHGDAVISKPRQASAFFKAAMKFGNVKCIQHVSCLHRFEVSMEAVKTMWD